MLIQPVRQIRGSCGSGGVRDPPNGGSFFMSSENGEDPENNRNGKAMSEFGGEEGEGEGWMGLSEETRDDIKTTGISFLIAVLIRFFLIEPRFIPSLSMFDLRYWRSAFSR